MPDTQAIPTLAQRIRAKFPGAYDDLNDSALETRVLAKHPEYSDLPRTSDAQKPPASMGITDSVQQAREAVPKPQEVLGFLSTVGSDLKSSLAPLNPFSKEPPRDINLERDAQNAYNERRTSGHGVLSSVGRGVAESGLGFNVKGIENSSGPRETAGHVAAGLIPWVAPEVISASAPHIPGALRTIGEAAKAVPEVVSDAAGAVKDAAGRTLRSQKTGSLKPLVRNAARITGMGVGGTMGSIGGPIGTGTGTVVGAVAGPSIADALIPDHPNPEGWTAKLPSRIPKAIAPETVRPGPVGTSTSPESVAAMPQAQPPQGMPPAPASRISSTSPVQVQMVDKIAKPAPPEPSRIQTPGSPALPQKVTLQSVPRENLVAAIKDPNTPYSARIQYATELRRNPGGVPREEVDSVTRYLMEPGAPVQPFRNYAVDGSLEKPATLSQPRSVTRFTPEGVPQGMPPARTPRIGEPGGSSSAPAAPPQRPAPMEQPIAAAPQPAVIGAQPLDNSTRLDMQGELSRLRGRAREMSR